MIKLISYLLKILVVGTVGTLCLGVLELLALMLWNDEYMKHAINISDLLTDELKIKNTK